MRRTIAAIAAILLMCSPAVAQQTPDFNGPAITYDYGSCTNSAGTNCTATTLNNYGANAQCFAADQSSTNPVTVTCSVSGTTVTVSNAQTLVTNTCATSAAASCTWTAPFAVSSFARCVSGGTSTSVISHCTLSGTTVTVTVASAQTDTWQSMLYYSVPSATGHTFSFLVLQ